LAEDLSDNKKAVMDAYECQLPEKERAAAYTLAPAVRRGADVRQSAANNTHVGRRVEDFLTELEQE
jgi:predicted lipid carrier protein YhbT